MSVTIDQELYEKAHSLGLNVSKVSENAIKACIDALETANGKTNPSLPENLSVAGGEGFEPSTPNLGGWEGPADDWVRFRVWLKEKNYRGGYDSTLYNYAQLYGDCLFKGDLSRLQGLRVSLLPNVLKALSALAKFTGKYEDWKLLVKNYGLSWGGRNADDIFIERMNKTQDYGEVWEWVRLVKTNRSALSGLLDLMAVSGLRFVEAIDCVNLIQRLKSSGKLGDYYKNGFLEHWRFKEVFIRNNKKAFVSIVPESIIEGVISSPKLPCMDRIKRQIRINGLHLRFGDIREAHGTLMTAYLKPSEIDFLHGRVTSSVFMANYFNPSLIGDLRERAFKGISEIMEKIKT